ncbi:EfeM/EfeO family lipoprotein [Streptacidiphilus sp. PB12-B1b]|uniref:iron uptake system protein EfeO n=1 Tax=Streptacidiphilus sp. PB12-B1b TaxID=2705012 RepID=UPI0015FC5BA9|nr:iron uptake system protein EfeO [Streptacidiphilus sp. PB12-B1b]QMU77978.1 EfeM/EfeO family lipoprotein [Streptacidiphilus sp. PB12-B1b]
MSFFSAESRRRRTAAAATTVTVLALAGGLTACGSSSDKSAGAASPAANSGSAAPAADAHKAVVDISTADGCAVNQKSFAAGAITFSITNKDAAAVSEVELLSGQRIVGEKENLPPGFSGTFAVNVDAGSYTLYCPGAQNENTTLTVTGKAAGGDASVDSLLTQGTKEYAAYVTGQVGYLVSSSEALQKAIQGGDLAAAQQAYMKARPYYEKIEPVAESFTVGSDNLDNDIDARTGDVPPAQWEGFHRIEMGLFQTKSLTGLSGYADGLVANVKKLQTLTTGLSYKPFELANGAQELLDEVASSKITGEEERYSHIDLLDFQANDEGAEQAFAALQPALQKIDPSLTGSISSSFSALDTLVDTYRTGSNASGFQLYTSLNDSDKQKLAAAVKAVQEPLSQVASKVANS